MKIASKISLSFAIVGALLISVAGSIFYLQASKSLERAVYHDLNHNAELYADKIELYLKMLKLMVLSTSKSVVLPKMLKLPKEDAAYGDAVRDAVKLLKAKKAVDQCIHEYMLLNSSGTIAASSDETYVGQDKSENSYFLGALKGVFIKDAYLSPTHREPLMAFSAPLIDDGTGAFLGVLVARVKLDELFDLLKSQTTMGKTGEVFILNKYSFMITPSRFMESGFLKTKIDTLNSRAVLSHKGGKHEKDSEKGEVVYLDYRSVPVLGAHVFIPEMGWGVIAKIDESEAFGPVRWLGGVVIAMILTMCLIAWLLGIWVAALITKTLDRLQKGTEIIGGGNLDYKIGVISKDEIGQLSRAFDRMTSDLKKKTTSVDLLNREIEERRKVESAMEESEKRFLDVMYTSQEAILLISGNKFVDANETAVRILGYASCEELLMSHPSELSPPTQPDGRSSAEKADEMIRKAFEEGYKQFGWMHRRANGEDFPVQVSLTPIQLQGTSVLYCVWKDLTEEQRNQKLLQEQSQKLTEALGESLKSREMLVSMLDDHNQMRSKLEQGRQRLESILSSAGEGILGMDTEGKCTFANAQALKLLGCEEGDLVGKTGHSVFHYSRPDGTPFPKSECPNFAALRDGTSKNGEDYYWRKDGTGFPVEFALAPLFQEEEEEEERKVIGAVISFLDITERKRANELTAARMRMVETVTAYPLREFLQRSLDEIERVSNSRVSFYHFVEKDQRTISLQAWSTATKERFCKAQGEGMHYSMDKAGVWTDAVRERRPVIHNDYKSLSHKKGLPEGHAEVVRELVIPIFREDRVVAILGVGNKPQNYDQNDVQGLSYLADVMWELTVYKLTEEALRESEEKMRSITDSAQDAIIMIDTHGNVSFWNPAAERILGYTTEDVMGRDVHRFLAPERFRAAQASAYPEFLKTGKGGAIGKTLELAALRKDGVEIPISLSLSAVRRGDGWHAVGIISDISERKRAEDSIRKFQRAIEQSPATVVITDLTGAIEYVNPKFTASTGYTPEEARGQNPRILKSGEMAPENYKNLWDTVIAGKEWRGEFHNKRKNGELYWEAASISPIRDGNGKITHFLAVKEDISEQKKAQEVMLKMVEDLEQSRQQAEAANKAKSLFLANISHEIRTPMNAIIGFSELLSRTDLDGEQRDFVNTMASSGQLLLDLVNDTLDFSKLEAGMVALEEIDFSLEVVCKDAFNVVLARIKKDVIRTSVDFDPRVPVHLKGDPTRIRQILVNLLSNAAKFTDEGEISLHVGLSDETTSDEEPVIQITVKDTGIGIPADKQEYIFQQFTQVDMSTTRKYGGTGLGLAICKALIERMGGRIWVESRENTGSEFKFMLRLKRGAPSQEDSAEPQVRADLAGKTVVIVDDESTAREILRRLCNQMGLTVACVVSSAGEALSYLKQAAEAGKLPDITLCDLRMPGMDGYQLAEKIHSLFPRAGMKVIAITSEMQDVISEKSEKTGFHGYLSKPVLTKDFARVLNVVLSGSQKDKKIVTPQTVDRMKCEGLRILVAEDTATNRKLLKAILSPWGCVVDFVSNGVEALEKLRVNPYDLCIMDLQMPVMGGLEATMILRREISKDLPVIALTAAVLDEDRLKCIDAGITDFIAKPIRIAELREKIAKHRRMA